MCTRHGRLQRARLARAHKIKARDMEAGKEHEFARAQKIKARDKDNCKEHEFARALKITARSQVRR